jgi:uncharacterized RDD family membrane protein YckC
MGDAADRPGTAEPASLAARLGALVVDWMLCVLIARIFGPINERPWLASVVLIAEYAVLLGIFGQTPGMALTKVRVVSVPEGGPIGVLRGFVRGVLLALLVPALIMDADRRGLHDKAARSIALSAR